MQPQVFPFNNNVNLYQALKYVYISGSYVFRKNKNKMELVGDFGLNDAAGFFEAAGWKRDSERAEHRYFNPIGTVE